MQKADPRQIVGFRGQRPANLGEYIEASQNYQADVLAELTKGLRLSPRAIGGYFQFHFIDAAAGPLAEVDRQPRLAAEKGLLRDGPGQPAAGRRCSSCRPEGKTMELWVANDLPERFERCRLQWSVGGRQAAARAKRRSTSRPSRRHGGKDRPVARPAETRMATIELALSDAAGKVLSRCRQEVFLKAWRQHNFVLLKERLCGVLQRDVGAQAVCGPQRKEFPHTIGRRFAGAAGMPGPRSAARARAAGRTPERAVDHPWCTVRRVCYQLWPGVYADAFSTCPSNSPSGLLRPSSPLAATGNRMSPS